MNKPIQPQAENQPTKMNIEYTEVALEQVLQYFVNGYKMREGKIVNHEAFVDTVKGKIILRLFVETEVKNHAE